MDNAIKKVDFPALVKSDGCFTLDGKPIDGYVKMYSKLSSFEELPEEEKMFLAEQQFNNLELYADMRRKLQLIEEFKKAFL